MKEFNSFDKNIKFTNVKLVIFPMILPVVWLSLIYDVWSYSNLNVVELLICRNNLSWFLNFILIFEMVDWGKMWLVNFNENSLFHLVVQITMVLSCITGWVSTYQKFIFQRAGIILLRQIGLEFSYCLSSKQVRALKKSMKFFFFEVAL